MEEMNKAELFTASMEDLENGIKKAKDLQSLMSKESEDYEDLNRIIQNLEDRKGGLN